jgi:hypothetical protein
MIPYDGEFALNTVYPLAFTAYDASFNSEKDAVLATMTDVCEILVDTTDPDFQKLLQKPSTSINSKLAVAKMRKLAAAPAATGQPAPAAPANAPTAAAQLAALAPLDGTPAAIPVDDRFGWVCRQKTAQGTALIVTFRGTQTAEDWLDNLDFIGEPYLPVPGRGTVHQGFQLIYYAVRKNLLGIVQNLAPGCTDLLVVGHSLGGALATLAMPDLLNVLASSNLSPTVYNLASPRAGHADFQNFFDSHVNVCYRIVNQWDLVPHLPPSLAGYVHVGNQLNIDSGFHINVVDNHTLLKGYLPGLIAWNKNHPVQQTQKLGSFAVASLVGVSA